MKLVETATGKSLATNYRQEVLQLKPEDDLERVYEQYGPYYLTKDGQEIDKLLMTKTHCGIYGIESHPNGIWKQFELFLETCASDGGPVSPLYDPADKVKKAVHLVRDPFDNIVSRMHHERNVGRGEEEGNSDEERFRSRCSQQNKIPNNVATLELFLSDEEIKIIEQVPCRTDFLKYILWHNRAFEVVEKDLAGIPMKLIHYESYDTNFDETVSDLLSFLDAGRDLHVNRFDAAIGTANVDSRFAARDGDIERNCELLLQVGPC